MCKGHYQRCRQKKPMNCDTLNEKKKHIGNPFISQNVHAQQQIHQKQMNINVTVTPSTLLNV